MATREDESAKTSIITHTSAIIRPVPFAADDVARLRGLKKERQARNTERAYKADWQAFSTWCERKGGDPRAARVANVCSYLVFMADERSAYASIERAVPAIAHELAKSDPDTWRQRPNDVQETLNRLAIRLGKRHRRQKRPLMLEDLKRGLDAAFPGTSLPELRARALLLLCFYLGCRRSEVVAIAFADVDTSDRRGIQVTIQRSKTDQRGEGNAKYVFRQPGSHHCPVRALAAWVHAAGLVRDGQAEGFVFRRVTSSGRVLGSHVHPVMVARLVQTVVEAAGLDPRRYGGHSLRSGYATDAAARGYSLEAIAHQTGHASYEQLRKYIRRVAPSQNNATDGFERRRPR